MRTDSDIVENWQEKFLSGDHSDDEQVVRILKAETKKNATPLLFSSASKIKTFAFLKNHGVNLIQRDDNGHTLLFDNYDRIEDLDAFRWLAEEFARHGAIDFAEDEGITPLSSTVKFGQLKRARILLENGASIHTFARIARYGGSRLDIPTQAINCLADSHGDDEDTSIKALKLLKEFGYNPSRDEAARLYDEVRKTRPRVAKWIAENL